MSVRMWMAVTVIMAVLLGGAEPGRTSEAETILEKTMSETLDTWRDGRYEQLFEQLAHRGKTSRETFVKKMRETATRPACCWQKMENFKILDEKRNEATVYVKIGLERASDAAGSMTREFKLIYQDGVWKMQLADVFSIAGVTAKKGGGAKRHKKNISPYQNEFK